MAIYIDIGLSAILLLSLIIGLIKGFAKQFTKGFCGLIGLVGAAALTLDRKSTRLNSSHIH